MTDDMFSFPAEEEINEERAEREPIPANTEAVVKARLEDDGTVQYSKGTGTTGKPWMKINFIVDGGEWDGRWCSMIFTVDPKNRYFRHHFQGLTGIDLSQGRQVGSEEFLELVKGARFRALIETNDKGYTNVTEILERLEGGAPVSEPPAAPAAGGEDEDIPF